MATTTAAVPTWVTERREDKAQRLAAVMRGRGMDARTAARLTAEQRAEVHAAAAAREGSGQSWRMAVEMLAGSHRLRSACPTCKMGDPDGVPGPPLPAWHSGPCTR